MFSRRLQPQMCGWKHLCLARRGTAWYAHGRQRDSSPPERMSWPRRKSGSMTGFTGHKKRPDLIRGGPYPPRAPPATLYSVSPAASFERAAINHFDRVSPVIKKADLIRGGPCPLELPSDTLSVSLPHLDDRQQKEPPAEAEALRLGCSVLADGSRIRQPSWLGLRCERLAALDDEVNGKDDKQDGRIARM